MTKYYYDAQGACLGGYDGVTLQNPELDALQRAVAIATDATAAAMATEDQVSEAQAALKSAEDTLAAAPLTVRREPPAPETAVGFTLEPPGHGLDTWDGKRWVAYAPPPKPPAIDDLVVGMLANPENVAALKAALK